MPAAEPITKAYLDARLDGIAATARGDIREFKHHVDGLLDKVDARFDRVDAELEAIKELLVFRKELRNLIRELKTKGIEVDERKVFVA